MEIPTGQEFYARLIEALRDADLPITQTSIAEFLDIHQSAISKWKSGESFPEMENAIKLAQRARVSLPWLLLGVGSKKQEENMDDQTVELLQTWARMPQSGKDELLEFLRFRAAKAEKAPDAPSRDTPKPNH